jgi:hypothetical protein
MSSARITSSAALVRRPVTPYDFWQRTVNDMGETGQDRAQPRTRPRELESSIAIQ